MSPFGRRISSCAGGVLVAVLTAAAPARALLPVCGGAGQNAITGTSHPLYTSADLGLGLVLSGTAQREAVAVSVTLAGRPAGQITLPGGSSQQAWSMAVDPHTVESLPDGVLVAVATVTLAGGGQAPAGQISMTKNVEPPAAPGSFSALAGEGRVTLSWRSPPDADFHSVRILRSTGAFASSPSGGSGQTLVYEGAATSRVDTGLSGGTTYRYTAFARDDAGNWSGPVTAQATPSTPSGPPPPPPPSQSVAFEDDFDGCTSSSGLGARWQVQGRWYCTSNRARGEVAQGIALADTSAVADADVRGRVYLTGVATGSGLVARAYGGSFYAARLLANGRLELTRTTPAGTTTLASASVPVLSGMRPMRLRVTGSDPVRLEAWVDDTLAVTATDASASRLASGQAGLLSGSVARTQFDDFSLAGAASGSDPDPDPQPSPSPPPPPPPPPPPTASSFEEDFGRCTSDTDWGSGWQTQGRWYCRSERGRAEVASSVALVRASLPADQHLQARVYLTGVATGSGLVARAQGGSYYAARLLATGRVEIVRVSGGAATVLGSTQVPRPDGFHTLRFSVTGSNPVRLDAWFEGAPAGSVVDGSEARLLSGQAGLLSGTEARTQFDDFSVR